MNWKRKVSLIRGIAGNLNRRKRSLKPISKHPLGGALGQCSSTFSTGKSPGRNSSGRITAFHRGGGSKRLQRRIDLKRSTSSMGIVERIEYDPNRSSRIAPVRWIDGVQLRCQRKCKTIEEFAPPRKILESTTTTIGGLFSCSSRKGRRIKER